MKLILTEEQQFLKDTAQSFAKDRTPVAHFRELRDSGNNQCWDETAWKEMVELGWSGILVPEILPSNPGLNANSCSKNAVVVDEPEAIYRNEVTLSSSDSIYFGTGELSVSVASPNLKYCSDLLVPSSVIIVFPLNNERSNESITETTSPNSSFNSKLSVGVLKLKISAETIVEAVNKIVTNSHILKNFISSLF